MVGACLVFKGILSHKDRFQFPLIFLTSESIIYFKVKVSTIQFVLSQRPLSCNTNSSIVDLGSRNIYLLYKGHSSSTIVVVKLLGDYFPTKNFHRK